MAMGAVHGAVLALLASSTRSKLADSTQPVWTVVDRPKIEKDGSLHHPQLVALPDGILVASAGSSGHWSDEGTNIYRSADEGRSWRTVRSGFPLSNGQLFVANHDVVLIGVDFGGRSGGGEAHIARSRDGGVTWSGATTIVKDSFCNAGSLHVSGAGLVQGGRVWMPYKYVKLSEPPAWAGLVVASAPNDADLLDSTRWTWSAPLSPGDTSVVAPDLWSLVPGPASTPVVRMRGSEGTTRCVADLSADGQFITVQQAIPDWIEPKDAASMTWPRDPETGRTYVLTCPRRSNPRTGESLIHLTSSKDLHEWREDSVVLRDSRPGGIEFWSADWRISGDDIVAVVCASGWRPDEQVESGESLKRLGLHFLRVPRFRTRTPQDPSIWEASPSARNEGK